MRSTLLSFDSTSPQLMHIRYQVEIKQASHQHQCTLIARDVDKNTVGQVTDLLPIGVSKIGRDIAIPTRLQAVNAAIASCK
jgi:hypothetical protein